MNTFYCGFEASTIRIMSSCIVTLLFYFLLYFKNIVVPSLATLYEYKKGTIFFLSFIIKKNATFAAFNLFLTNREWT